MFHASFATYFWLFLVEQLWYVTGESIAIEVTEKQFSSVQPESIALYVN